ncbi:transcriptional regulator [Streptomyces sp. MRC013]|uniref:transcriptional regulator n=1 Tax=Streptomyces sp. MRC013 TaxID=2898276 RepID=UPI002025C3AB|nr:transcriptional regulator [Streptomyces sp. MRC013]URM92455.1 transcriptional regulator [Streptomyces sp. MRC013]
MSGSARGGRSRADVAAAEVSAETLREIGTGRAPAPAFFPAAAPGVSRDEPAAACADDREQGGPAAFSA